MTQTDAKIRQGLEKLTRKGNEVLSAYVVSVDEEKALMNVKLYDGELEIEDVLLNAVEEETLGILLIPEVDSDVVISCVDGSGEYMLVRASKLSKVLITISGTKFQLDKDGIVMNDGGNDGIPITKSVIQQLNKVEEDVNKLKQIFSSWSPVSQDGGAALKAAAASWSGQQLQKSKDADIKNDKVKH